MAAPPSGVSPLSFKDALTAQKPISNHMDPRNFKPTTEFKGEIAVLFEDDEIDFFSEPFKRYLVGKFPRGRPNLIFIREQFKKIGFKGEPIITALDRRHIFIKFALDEDIQRCWIKRNWNLGGTLMKVLKWTKNFDINEEPPLVPVWLTVEFPPAYCSHTGFIPHIGSRLGDLIFADPPTINHTRPSTIRLCVEMDLTGPFPDRIRLGSKRDSKWYPVYYEDHPEYCLKCNKIGHNAGNCGIPRAAQTVVAPVSVQTQPPTVPELPATQLAQAHTVKAPHLAQAKERRPAAPRKAKDTEVWVPKFINGVSTMGNNTMEDENFQDAQESMDSPEDKLNEDLLLLLKEDKPPTTPHSAPVHKASSAPHQFNNTDNAMKRKHNNWFSSDDIHQPQASSPPDLNKVSVLKQFKSFQQELNNKFSVLMQEHTQEEQDIQSMENQVMQDTTVDRITIVEDQDSQPMELLADQETDNNIADGQQNTLSAIKGTAKQQEPNPQALPSKAHEEVRDFFHQPNQVITRLQAKSKFFNEC